MRLTPHLAALAAATLASLAGARAQDPGAGAPPDDVRAEVERLGQRLEDQARELDALRRQLDAQAALVLSATATQPPAGHPPLAVSFDGALVEVTGQVAGKRIVLHPRCGVQTDLRAFPADDALPDDQFVLRRARVGFDGTLGDFSFAIQVQVQRSTTQLVDAFVQWQTFEAFKLRVGHFKTPFSIDNGVFAATDFTSDFVERPMVIGTGQVTAPDFETGVEALGTLFDKHLSYWLSVTNQVDLNKTLSDDFLYVGRLETTWGAVALGGAAAWQWSPTTTNSFSGLTPGQFTFFAPVNVRGQWQRYEVDVAVYEGPVWGRLEAVYAEQERRGVAAGGRDGTPLATQGAHLTLGLVLGGKPEGAKPSLSPLDGWRWLSWDVKKMREARQAGLEVVGRVEWCRLDDRGSGGRTATGGRAPSSTAPDALNVRGNECTALSLGVNFSPIETVKLMADWVHLWIADQARGERRNDEQSDEVLLRAQLDF